MPLQSPEIQAFATGFPLTVLHAAITVVILFAAAALYIMLTPHKEIALIREGNTAAAVSLAGVLVGLATPLAVSLKASTTIVELALWGVAITLVQLLIFRVVDLVLHGLPRRIQDGEMAAAATLVGAKLATALILAAAVSG
jgi:putative membrane protein